MKKKKDIVTEAAKALAETPVPPGPPQETVDTVIAKLPSAGDKPPPKTIIKKLKDAKSLPKLAAAAVLLIAVGYAAGRLLPPRELNGEQLQALETSLKSSLEPAIQRDIVAELNNQWTLALATSHLQLKDDLNQQFHRDLNIYAIQTLAASNTVTNQLLTNLIAAINTAQTQDRQWVAAALEQMELNHLQDNSQLRNDFATLAVLTEDELQQTRQNVAQWITYGRPDNLMPEESKNFSPPKQKE